MGRAAALRLLDTGHEVLVWNRTMGNTAEVVEAGARAPADLAETVETAETVMTVLSDDDAVREVVFGDGGVARVLEDRLYLDASTVSPSLTTEVAEGVKRFLALPIAGAPAALRDGKATCLVGGPGELVDEAMPVVEALSSAHHVYARPEQAAAAKIANNNLLLVGLAALAESIAIGRAGGLTDQQLHELFDTSAMLAPGVRNRLDAVLTGEGPTWWTMQLGVKDSSLALSVARQAAADTPVSAAARERYEAAAARGLAEEDIAAIGRLYRSGEES
jgi:3-hydroxyisobutyrate dehydrogenase